MAGTLVKTLTTSIGIDALRPQIREWVNEGRKEFDPIYPKILNVSSTDMGYEEDYEMGGFPTLPRLDEGDDINFFGMGFGNKTRYEPDMYQGAFAVSEKMRRLNKIGLTETMSKRVGKAGRVTMEQIAATLFNNGFNPAFLGSDGQPLFSTNHANANGDTGISNTGTAATFSATSLEAAVNSFINMKGQDGYPINISPAFVITGPALALPVQRVLKSENFFTQTGNFPDTSAARGVPNVLTQYNMQPIMLPYITSQTAWFVVAAKGQHYLNLLNGLKPTDDMFRDPFTMDYIYSHFFETVAGWSSYIGVYGNQGA